MRFPEFKDEWKIYKAHQLLESFTTNSLSWEQLTFEQKNIKNIHYGLIHKRLPILTNISDSRIPFIINEKNVKTKTYIKKGDLIFADASEDYDGVATSIEIINDEVPSVSGLHTIHTREIFNLFSLGFKGYLFNTPKVLKQFKRLAVGSKVHGISFSNFKDVNISIPADKNEQSKIVKILSLIDQRIETQRKLIENYKSLIKIIRKKLFSYSIEDEKYLDKICTITTGKLDANAMNEKGKYAFFTCSKEQYMTNTFSFQGEALIIAGNGEIGSVKYYNGRFDAYQRTYVLQNFSSNIKFIMYYLQQYLPEHIAKEKNIGAMTYIVLRTLSNIKICFPSEKSINKIVTILNVFEQTIYTKNAQLKKYNLIKSFLLSTLFI